MGIKSFIHSLLRHAMYGASHSSKSLCTTLRKAGAHIGDGVVFYDPPSNAIDMTNPTLLTLGDNVRITHGVVILTHDYSWSVLAGAYGECLGGVAPVTIGNNVFIGINAIILKGVTIGDNAIIGAGSVVTRDIPSNEVWGGNPAKKIMTLEEYYAKKKYSFEGEKLVKMMETNSAVPYGVFREFEPLFKDYREESIQKLFHDTGYADKCNEFYKTNERKYQDFAEFKLASQKKD